MSSISAITYPTWDDLGHIVAGKLSRSIDCRTAKTTCSRTIHFLRFVDRYKLRDVFLTSDTKITDLIIERYVNSLLDGYSINRESITVGTIGGYMRAVNLYYKTFGLPEPWQKSSGNNAAVLLKDQSKFEEKGEKREPLHHKVIALMLKLAQNGSNLGFRKSIWLWTALARYGGFRRQEFAMEKKNEIQVYIKPNGELVVRAFCLRNFLFYDKDGLLISYKEVLANHSVAHQTGQHYEIQKNRMNDQIIKQNRDISCPELCPVELAIKIVDLAVKLGVKTPTDPLGVFQSDDGDILYLTGDQITKYYRYVTRLVFPSISDADLRLFSCHSVRVLAAVLLHEAGKDGPYIKLRLRWLSDCFQIYLRNTTRICAQHTAALIEINEKILQALADFEATIPDSAVHATGDKDTDIEIDDDD